MKYDTSDVNSAPCTHVSSRARFDFCRAGADGVCLITSCSMLAQAYPREFGDAMVKMFEGVKHSLLVDFEAFRADALTTCLAVVDQVLSDTDVWDDARLHDVMQFVMAP